MPSNTRQRTHLDFRPIYSIIEFFKKQGLFGLFFRFPPASPIADREQDENQQKYEKTQMQREIVIQRLKEQGCRITKQRMVLLDIILNENCSSCKEIYYKASRIDSRIGTATVYRMINTLEEIGAINRRNMYKIDW